MDFDVVDGGSVVLLIPNTPEAEAWVSENLPEDAPTLGKGFGVERRYIGAILNGLTEDGLTF